MKRRTLPWLVGVGGILIATRPAFAVLGLGDVSFVTVVANPAEAGNWISQLQALSNQLEKLKQTEAQIEMLRNQAGDPAAAARAGSDLSVILSAQAAIVGAPATVTAMSAAAPGNSATALKALGLGLTMPVLGEDQTRDLARYQESSQQMANLDAFRAQISQEQSQRVQTDAALDEAWTHFRSAATESEKQSALTRISELNASDSMLSRRREAMATDFTLAEKEGAVSASLRAGADDERWIANGKAIAALEEGRAQAAEAQRLAVISAPAASSGAADYSSLKLWTPADAQGGGQ